VAPASCSSRSLYAALGISTLVLPESSKSSCPPETEKLALNASYWR
jgi:hypothetical protein